MFCPSFEKELKHYSIRGAIEAAYKNQGRPQGFASEVNQEIIRSTGAVPSSPLFRLSAE